MRPNKKNILYMLRESNAIEGVYGRSAVWRAREAWDYIMRFEKINPQIIKQTHKILMNGQDLPERYKGEFRDIPVSIGGKNKSQSKETINKQMRAWCERTNTVDKNFDPVTLHIQFEEIHPFVDGNGRIGRILLNWHLVKRNGAPLLVYTEEGRATYYRLFESHRAEEMKQLIEKVVGIIT